MTIYEIKRLTQETAPYFFTRKSMKFFGQTLKDFKVKKVGERYMITAPAKGLHGRYSHKTIRFFNPKTNKLERE